jgi:hypothetical protein
MSMCILTAQARTNCASRSWDFLAIMGRGIFPATSRLKWLLLHDLHVHLHFSCVGSHTTRVPPLGRGICPENVRINGSCHMPLRLRGLAQSVRCRVLRLLQHFYCKFSHKRALVEVLPNSCLQVLAWSWTGPYQKILWRSWLGRRSCRCYALGRLLHQDFERSG